MLHRPPKRRRVRRRPVSHASKIGETRRLKNPGPFLKTPHTSAANHRLRRRKEFSPASNCRRLPMSEKPHLCKAFLVEAKWLFEKETPTFKAYLENAVVSASMMFISVHVYFLLTETITKEALECLMKKEYHPLIECPSLIFRLSNGLATSKNGDGHGAPDNQAKNRVLSLIIEPITPC
ncbi:hypothetical protein C3L33_11935, partial [Rhododendron williamsianum]